MEKSEEILTTDLRVSRGPVRSMGLRTSYDKERAERGDVT